MGTKQAQLDSIDQIVSRVDEQDVDKYRTPTALKVQSTLSSQTQSALTTDSLDRSMLSTDYTTEDETRGAMRAASSLSTTADEEMKSQSAHELYEILGENDHFATKQKFAYFSIIISSVQLLILALQLSLCGVAPLDINPLVGAYPDTLSDWGGKNPFLLKEGEYWRIVTPAFLHVGVIQLLVNAAVQLETCALFEREWGSIRYLWIYIISEIGCSIVSSCTNPDSIGVGSSGALMGLYGAKLAQVVTQVCFDFNRAEADSIRLEQLSSILCSMSIVLGLSYFTYIDWAGHMGAMGTGFIVGMISFSRPIYNRTTRTIWRLAGIILLLTTLPLAFYLFFEFIKPDVDLGDPCEYFRNLYSEGYECHCSVF